MDLSDGDSLTTPTMQIAVLWDFSKTNVKFKNIMKFRRSWIQGKEEDAYAMPFSKPCVFTTIRTSVANINGREGGTRNEVNWFENAVFNCNLQYPERRIIPEAVWN